MIEQIHTQKCIRGRYTFLTFFVINYGLLLGYFVSFSQNQPRIEQTLYCFVIQWSEAVEFYPELSMSHLSQMNFKPEQG